MRPRPRSAGRGVPAAAVIAVLLLASRAQAGRLIPGGAVAPTGETGRAAIAVRALRSLDPGVVAPGGWLSVLAPAGESVVGGGVVQLRVREEVAGVPVLGAEHAVFFTPAGEVLAVREGRRPTPGRPGPFLVGPERAAAAADAVLEGGPAGGGAPDLAVVDTDGEWTGVGLPGTERVAWVRRVVLPEGPRAAWQVTLAERDAPDRRWTVLVDGTSGAVLETTYATKHAAVRGRVWPRGALQPSELVDWVDGRVVMDPASPEGWLWADATEGNNLYAWDDRAGDGGGTPGVMAVGSGDPLTFDVPFTGDPATDLEAALANAFWATNWAHDRFHALGFDEASGSCQDENFGRGGAGGDRTRVSVQFRATDLATVPYNAGSAYTARGDGGYNQVLLGLWDTSGELRDGALDTPLVIHEYAHLVSLRMLGADSACDDGIQPAGLQEGWSDYFAASFTGETVMGAYVTGDPAGGLRTRPVGENTYTYLNLCNISSANCRNTENGEIWSATLWGLREALIALHGPEEGAWRADQLVLEGMRFTPCNPTFVQARDGILMADVALRGGADRCVIWQAMVDRGLGYSADTTGPDDALPLAAFDVPPECAGASSLAWDRERYGDDSEAALVLAEPEATSRGLSVSSSSGDEETLEAPASASARRVPLTIAPLPAVPGDGVLQVADGDVVTASCPDCPGAPSAEALIDRGLGIVYLSHDLRDQTCDEDDDPDFGLPPLLDAGEYARIDVTLGNAEPFPLEDLRLRLTCDHPGLTFLPQGEFPVGDVPARTGVAWPFTILVRAVLDAGVAFGETATFTVHASARGLEGETSFTLRLAADYDHRYDRVAWGQPETFEVSSPSVGGWSHRAAGGQPGDLWSLQGCGDGGGRAMVYAGPDCTEYDDTPAAALLSSPPVFDVGGSGLAAVPTSIRWRNDVDLGRDERSLYCDSEMVVLYLTDDPDRPTFEDPRADRGPSVQYWVQWTGLGNERNTGGWVTATPQQAIDERDVRGMDLAQVRLVWGFFTDVYNPFNNGGCRLDDPDAVGGGYKLDEVELLYDSVGAVPTAAGVTCDVAPDCFTWSHLVAVVPDEAPCPGDTVYLSAEASEGFGQPCTLVYRFTGPGFDTGYTESAVAQAPAAPDASWTVRVRCMENTDCTSSTTVRTSTLQDSHGGSVRPGSLRVARSGDDVLLRWTGTRSPPTHAVFRAEVSLGDPGLRAAALSALAQDPPPPELRTGSPDGSSYRDPGAAGDGAGLHAWRVFGRAPCSGEVQVD